MADTSPSDRETQDRGTQRAMFATAPHGVADLLARELADLGGTDVKIAGSGVRFHAKPEILYRICLWSRLANRILLPIHKGRAESEDELYHLVQSIDWSQQLSVNETLAVDFFSSRSKITHTLYGAQKVKDAIVDQFRSTTGDRPSVDRDSPGLRVNVYLHRDEARVAIDLSGSSLHRRGYREKSTRAPLKENLAAAMLIKAGWPELCANGGSLHDPMCGSGTLLTEAALIATDSAPGLKREYFGFLGWRAHDEELWQSVRDEAEARAKTGREELSKAQTRLSGSDNDRRALETCRENLASAGVEHLVTVSRQDFFDNTHTGVNEANHTTSKDPAGLVIFNPPYGERLQNTKSPAAFFRDINHTLRVSYSSWLIGILVPDDSPLHLLRLSPALAQASDTEKKNKSRQKKPNAKAEPKPLAFSNGGIDCRFMLGSVSAKTTSEPASNVWGNAKDAALADHSPTALEPAVTKETVWNSVGTKVGKKSAVDKGRDAPPSMFRNRLAKNRKKLASWIKNNDIRVYRLYDADMPEYAVAIDVYLTSDSIENSDTVALETHVVVQEYRAPASVDAEKAAERLRQVLLDTAAELELAPEQVHLKVRERQKGASQYGKNYDSGNYYFVSESNCFLRVNFDDYLDTGLFADSRKIRTFIRQQSEGKRFLNLFSYTASATVQAIAGGATHSSSVDSSKTYTDWAQKNLALNGINVRISAPGTAGAQNESDKNTGNTAGKNPGEKNGTHQLVRADVMTWLAGQDKNDEKYDLILLDPPTYSNSRDLEDWNVQTDYAECIKRCLAILSAGGCLIFCTNFKRFRLDPELFPGIKIENRSGWSIDRDFARNSKIHQCWMLTHP